VKAALAAAFALLLSSASAAHQPIDLSRLPDVAATGCRGCCGCGSNYDGSRVPSVDAPVGDFFAVSHGFERPVESLVVRASSEGRSRNSYWSMPFRRSCRITVTNEGPALEELRKLPRVRWAAEAAIRKIR
jgi:hypothetical protein